MNEILLVEDNPDDVELTLRAFRQSKIANEIVVAHDGVEALDYLFATGDHAGRDNSTLPQLVLLDLKLPRIDGLQVLERIRANPKTKLLPVVILTSSSEEPDLKTSYGLGASVQTSDVKRALRVAKAVRAGSFGVNGYTVMPNAPFGGFQQSGLGREGGRAGIEEFTELKTVCIALGDSPV